MKKKMMALVCVAMLSCAVCIPVSAGVVSPGSENVRTEEGDGKSDTSPKTGEGQMAVFAAVAAAMAAGVAAGANKKRKEA